METGIVALLDVLGFQQHLLRHRHNSDRGLELYRDAWNGAKGFLGDTAARWSRRVLTDNIVLIGDSAGQEGPALLDFVLSAGRFQFELAIRGFWLRGGVCLGEIYEDGEFVYGSALVDAHNLEVRAEHPRIVVGESLRRIAESQRLIASTFPSVTDLDSLADPNGRLPFVRDGDQPYIDYLLAFHQTSQGENGRGNAVLMHAQRIAAGLHASDADYRRVVADPKSSEDQKRKAQRVRAKYRWLETYHDSYCRLARLPDQFLVSSN